VQPEPERLADDEIYELDREAWNLPRPRAHVEIASAPKAPPDDRSGYGSDTAREAESSP
jgi:hypothetical protein